MNELALKEDHDNFPVLIEYGLTPYGQTLSPLIGELHAWGTAHRKRIFKQESELA